MKGYSIHKRGKNYVIQYNTPEKRNVRKSLKTTNRHEAEERARELIKIIESEGKIDFIKKIAEAKKVNIEGIRVKDAWERYLKSPQRSHPSEATIKSKWQYWKQFIEWFDGEFLYEVTTDTAKKYAEYLLSTGIKNQTYNHKKNFLKEIFEILAEEANIEKNPFSVIRTKPKEEYNSVQVTEKEVKALIKSTNGEDRALFALGAYAGCRFKDACLMKWENIDMEEGVLRFRPAKTKNRLQNKYVTVPILKELNQALDSLRGNSTYILPNWSQTYLKDRAGCLRAVKNIMIKSGIKTTSKKNKEGIRGFHAFRHFFVNYCHKNKVPFYIVQNIVGHGNSVMTMLYTHVDIEATKQAFESDGDKALIQRIKTEARKLENEKLKNDILKLLG